MGLGHLKFEHLATKYIDTTTKRMLLPRESTRKIHEGRLEEKHLAFSHYIRELFEHIGFDKKLP